MYRVQSYSRYCGWQTATEHWLRGRAINRMLAFAATSKVRRWRVVDEYGNLVFEVAIRTVEECERRLRERQEREEYERLKAKFERGKTPVSRDSAFSPFQEKTISNALKDR